MKSHFVSILLFACGLAVGLPGPASAGRKPSVAVMPAQYFSADRQSAENLTGALSDAFAEQGYDVIAPANSRLVFQGMGLLPDRHYTDDMVVRFGLSIGADLVVYPRLLSLGTPSTHGDLNRRRLPAAVILVRVVSTRSRRALYTRQVGYEFEAEPPRDGGSFTLPLAAASGAADAALKGYFLYPPARERPITRLAAARR